jgi:acyl carrier protein phosphodiesterase
VPFPQFTANTYRLVSANSGALPERLHRILPLLFEEWLPSYREIAGIELALRRMSARLVRPNPLGEGGAELRRIYGELHEDFRGFFPELQALAGMGKA